MEHDSDFPNQDLFQGLSFIEDHRWHTVFRPGVVNGFLRAKMVRLIHASSDINPRKGNWIVPRIKAAIQPVPANYRKWAIRPGAYT